MSRKMILPLATFSLRPEPGFYLIQMHTAMYGSPKPELISERCDIGNQLGGCLLKFTVNGLGGGNRQIRRNPRRYRQAQGKKCVVGDIVIHR
jgi:hypothetical protein